MLAVVTCLLAPEAQQSTLNSSQIKPKALIQEAELSHLIQLNF